MSVISISTWVPLDFSSCFLVAHKLSRLLPRTSSPPPAFFNRSHPLAIGNKSSIQAVMFALAYSHCHRLTLGSRTDFKTLFQGSPMNRFEREVLNTFTPQHGARRPIAQRSIAKMSIPRGLHTFSRMNPKDFYRLPQQWTGQNSDGKAKQAKQDK